MCLRICLGLLFVVPAYATDPGGKYAQANPDMHKWFDGLSAGYGNCCSVADGRTIADPDIDPTVGHIRVRIDGVWIDVPDEAVVKGPNRFGQAVVWPSKDPYGKTYIRCYLPGAGM